MFNVQLKTSVTLQLNRKYRYLKMKTWRQYNIRIKSGYCKFRNPKYNVI